MIAIPSYRGPTEWHNNDGMPLVPIVPSIARWEKNDRPCSRKQYPLRLAYAISIHKSQRMTLNKAVIANDFVRGLSFVALSRVRRLCDFACHTRIGVGRFKKHEGLDKVAEDFHRRQRLPFYDAVKAAAVLAFIFND
jgi:hypothetical protein